MKKLLTTLLFIFFISAIIASVSFASEAESTVNEDKPAISYTDISSSAYSEKIIELSQNGLVLGYNDNTFRPGRAFTRVELARLISELLDLQISDAKETDFSDIDIADKDFILAAVSNGIMNGRTDTYFGPYDTVVKSELMNTLENVVNFLDIKYPDNLFDDTVSNWTGNYTIATAEDVVHASYGLYEYVLEKEASEQAELEAEETLSSEEMDVNDPINDSVSSSGEMETDTVEATDEITDSASEEQAELSSEEPSDVPAEETVSDASDDISISSSSEPKEESSTEMPANTPDNNTVNTPAPVTESPAVESTQPQSVTQPSVVESQSEEDIIRNQIYEFYYSIRDNIVAFFKDLF